MTRKWQSLAELQQQVQLAETVPVEPVEPVELVEPPEAINDAGRAAIALLKRWRANTNDDGAAVATLFAVFGSQSPIGRMVLRWRPLPIDILLVEIAYENGARLADMGNERVLRSSAAAEMIRHRIEPGKRRKPMGFQTHAALLGYWRERRELLHALRAFGMEKNANAHRTGLMIRSVELLVQRLEDSPVRIMSPKGYRDGK
jgi:hypothetical protein